jgi:thiamine biosynthesis lipoprotein
LLVSLALLLAAPNIAAGPGLEKFEAVEPHMGTLVRVTVYTANEQAARDAFRAAFDRIRELDRILSDYKPDSELNQIATAAVGRPVPVSDDLFAVLHASQDLARATDGAFDITQGPVVRLWRAARKTARLPDPAALKEAASRSGFRKLHLDDRRRTVTLDVAGMALDVGAIGKGYAASEALAVLSARSVRSAMVAVSGDLAFSKPPPGQRGWHVRVHTVDASITNVPDVLELTNAAVSTSGSSEQYVEIDGRRYSHVVDPRSGMGLAGDITVTVIARTGLDADGLDTAVSVLGAERGLPLVASRGAAALVVQRTGAKTTVLTSPNFPALADGPRHDTSGANATPSSPAISRRHSAGRAERSTGERRKGVTGERENKEKYF